MASSAFYKKVNSQMTLGFDQVQPLLEQLTAELSLSRPSDPIETMIQRLKEMEADIRGQVEVDTKAKYDKVVAPRKMITIFGPAYSGKTTQCSMALGDRGAILSPYELLNEAVNSGRQKNGTATLIPEDLQLQVLDLMRRGERAPTSILTRLLVNRILQVEAAEEKLRLEGGQPQTKVMFFLDGYPRTVEQALALETALGEIHCALLLFCPKEVCMKRMIAAGVSEEDRLARWQLHEDCTIPLEEYWKAKKSLRVVDGSLDRNQTNTYVKSFIID